ncbi:hypothetical protein H6G80_14120 [Nostoc sp. FACHB-87]|uniref:hypothetical protein n=1 Tax=Nostocaceae TaxID=1162 RepID=UPI001682AF17|nr:MULTISPECIES: hypothetical protein [Nostocaceae]MBD2455216.1 hypothetical protein [Nostoc sp. FACHB-87]MBD2476959.1 hypothetical protein [Anabaena sp. FACHB-83]
MAFELSFGKTITLLHQPSLFILLFWRRYCGSYCIYCHKTQTKPVSNKEFSPEIIRLGQGKLEKVKTSGGFVIRGLRQDDAGGLIESIIRQS